MTLATLLPKLDTLVADHLRLWEGTEDGRLHLLNIAENVTYLVETLDEKAVLRLHRPGYHKKAAIESELAWLDAVARDTALSAPRARIGRDGAAIQQFRMPGEDTPVFMVMFDFIDGEKPQESGDLTPGFQRLGAIAAQLHTHVENWSRPPGFQRQRWDLDAVFGPKPIWGDWRAAPGVTAEIATLLTQAEATLRARLTVFGSSPVRFNLIHADMRLANLLVSPAGTQVIDFDDCGFGWLLYDFAAAISFIEDDPRVPALKAAWLEGYRVQRALSAEDEAEMDSFIMLRRMALLAWIGSHMDAPEPQALAGDFAARTAALAEAWLSRVI